MEDSTAAVTAALRELLKVPNDEGKVLTALNTILIYVGNVLKEPNDPKFSKIGALNKAFQARVAAIPQALLVLRAIGFESGIEENFFVLKGLLSESTKGVCVEKLKQAKAEIENARSILLSSQSAISFDSSSPAPSPSTSLFSPSLINPSAPSFLTDLQANGFCIDVPLDWKPSGSTNNDPASTTAIFTTNGVALAFQYYPTMPFRAVYLLDDLLDDYRHDLRLVAAAAEGGLIECDIYPEGFVAGITKRPQPKEINAKHGISYYLHCLIPAKVGYLAITGAAHEGEQTGLKEALLASIERGKQQQPDQGQQQPQQQQQQPQQPDLPWFSDPYDYPLPLEPPAVGSQVVSGPNNQQFNTMEVQERHPMAVEEVDPELALAIKLSTAGQGMSLFEAEEGFFNPWTGIRYPYSRADLREHDKIFHMHPLGRLRSVLEVLKKIIRVDTPVLAAAKERKTDYVINGEIAVQIPPAFRVLPANNMTHGTVFLRTSFNEEMQICNVTLQPQFPDCGKNIEQANAITYKHIEWGHLDVIYGPLVSQETIAGRQGFLNQSEAYLTGKAVYTAAFYMPWGDTSIEVSCVAQRGNHATARKRLKEIVEHLPAAPSSGATSLFS